MAKKLIEVALPLEAINDACGKEKTPFLKGHPRNIHLWWARRPLAAARAVIWSSLVDDPSEHPEMFPTEEEQQRERARRFKMLSDLVVWENSNNEAILNQAKSEILKYTGGNPPALLDPFAGGGAIPLEAQRLGLEAHAHDLNPVAVMINKAMIEIPPRFEGSSPVNPDSRRLMNTGWKGAAGLAEDVQYYGQWMKEEAQKRIGHLYPKVKVPTDQGGGEATVIAWIWARTVKCPNPACGCEMPLASSFILSSKKGNEAWAEPVTEGDHVNFHVHKGKCPKEFESYKMGRSALFKCPFCGQITTDQYIKESGVQSKIGVQLMAIVAEGDKGRIYISPNEEHSLIASVTPPEDCPTGSMPSNPRWFSPPAFGMTDYSDLFTNRQLTALTTFSDLVTEAQKKATEDAVVAGMANDFVPLADGGKGATAYGQAVGIYLGCAIDQLSRYSCSLCGWNTTNQNVAQAFGRQAIPMVWDFAEANTLDGPLSISTAVSWEVSSLRKLGFTDGQGYANQHDAQSDCGLRNIMVSTDPPYYDNIGYADLSDFFYVWMRRSLKSTYPELFRTMLVPKTEELIATPYRHDGSAEKAKEFFEEGMFSTCKQLYKYTRNDIPVTIYYAYRQSDTDSEKQTSSTGWETMLSAIIKAGFAITGTWPFRTERTKGLKGNVNALASSIVLACRKRSEEARTCTRRDFVTALKRELKPALKKLQQSNIAPVDLAQSAIGPGIGVFSRYKSVLEPDGSAMSVRSALQIINQELDLYFSGQDQTIDSDSRFCVELFTQYAYNTVRFGDADILARAKGTSVASLAAKGIVYAAKGEVRLLERNELSDKIKENETNIWLLCQQLTHLMETGGIKKCAEIVVDMLGSNAEEAKNLAYRLYSVCERKNWAQEAYAYNSLVVAWQDIQSKAAEIKAARMVQLSIYDTL